MNNGLLSTRKLLDISSSVDYMCMYMASTVQYCAKVMRAKFVELCSLFSRILRSKFHYLKR